VRAFARGILALGLGTLVASDAAAVTTRSFNVASYKEFDEGDAEGVLVSSEGEVTPGRAKQRLAIESDAVWTATRAPDGTVYAGGLDKGQIWAISGGKVRLLASLEKETPWIGSLLVVGDTLYVGTVATGSVHALDVKSGKLSLVAKLDTDHVWALAPGDGKTIYAATGAAGKLFQIDVASKKATLVWDADEPHLLSMARAADGALWLGSAEEAILYRFDPRTKQARAVADFAGSEVKALAVSSGGVIAAVNDFDTGTGTPPAGKKPVARGQAAKPAEAGTPGTEKGTAAETAPRPGERKGKGAVWRIETDGRVEQLHATSEGYFQALAAVPGSDDVFASTGTGGKLYQIRRDRSVLTVFDVEERQVNAIMAWEGGLAFATGDSAALYTGQGAAKDAKWVSKVLDAGFPARWGNLRFRGEGGLTVETRSGNTAKPDAGWSAWQKLGATSKGGGDAQVGAVGSPGGRYLQVRVGLATGSALRQVTGYYLPQNQRARLTDVSAESDAGKAPVTTASGAAKARSPMLKLKWKVENSDGDDLAYGLEIRPEGEPVWRPVPMGPAGEPFTKLEYEWNTESVPDGIYRARVTVHDGRANPAEHSLSHQLISPPFLVDNGRPLVADLTVKYPSATGRATDSFSRIDEIAWSLDGGDWQIAYPKDGIFDDVSESFSVRLPDGLAPGLHTLAVRVADEADNIGAASVTFKVGK
jgi:hypothetical protein